MSKTAAMKTSKALETPKAKAQGEAITKAAEGKVAALLKEAAQAQKESDKLAN